MQKLEILSPYAHPLCTIIFQGFKFKRLLFFIVLICSFFLSQVNVIRIIKLNPFQIIIITNTHTIHLNS
jgi:hypothetical protein